MIPNSAAARDVKNVLHGFTELSAHSKKGPVVIVGGKGVYVEDEDGTSYLEGVAGMWCTSFGFGEKALVDAATAQLNRLPYYHTVVGKSVGPAIDLAERLAALVPIPNAKVYFGLAGSDANDFLVKAIHFYNNALGRPDKKRFIARVNGYHGSSMMAGSLTGVPANRKGFDQVPGVLHVSDPNYFQNALPGESQEAFAERLAQELEELILREGADTIAAFIAEPITGAGGVVIPPEPYYARVSEILKRHDILFCADEVITGVFRTGKLWGCDTMGIKPDAMTMAKGLTSAYQPLSAVILSDEIYQGLEKGSVEVGWFGYGQTYSGHPVGCAVALKVLDLLEERNIAAHVERVSEVFVRRLNEFRDHPLVGEVRAVGLIGAIEFSPAKIAASGTAVKTNFAKTVRDRAESEYKMICRGVSTGEVCCFSPPLIITDDEVNLMFDRFASALADVAAGIG